jgi:hypothetical protein
MLLFALVLGLTALATAIAPPPPSSRNDTATAPVPPPTSTAPAEVEITFNTSGKPLTHHVASDAHVLVQVVSPDGGEVTIPKLGRIDSVSGGSPVTFDLVDLAPGRYDVLFEPSLGQPVRVGTLVSSR